MQWAAVVRKLTATLRNWYRKQSSAAAHLCVLPYSALDHDPHLAALFTLPALSKNLARRLPPTLVAPPAGRGEAAGGGGGGCTNAALLSLLHAAGDKQTRG